VIEHLVHSIHIWSREINGYVRSVQYKGGNKIDLYFVIFHLRNTAGLSRPVDTMVAKLCMFPLRRSRLSATAFRNCRTQHRKKFVASQALRQLHLFLIASVRMQSNLCKYYIRLSPQQQNRHCVPLVSRVFDIVVFETLAFWSVVARSLYDETVSLAIVSKTVCKLDLSIVPRKNISSQYCDSRVLWSSHPAELQ
jgi:hypothetical protein